LRRASSGPAQNCRRSGSSRSTWDSPAGTVNKVYDALAREGLVETAGRHGTIVLDNPSTATGDDLAAAADTLALVVRQLGLNNTAAHAALDDALHRL
jgi:DNA-binding transcriptional regulator YhcF (GntR family)